MIDQINSQTFWIWKYCSRTNYNKIKSNECNYYVSNILRAKIHLFHIHNINED